MALPIQKPQIRDIPVSSLKPAPYNPRRIDDAAIAGLTKSLERFGYVEPIIWNERTGYVVGGHQRLKVLRASKVENVPVVVVDLDETEEKALNVALNSPHLTGEFTDDLQALLAEIQGADSMLFNELRLDELLGEIAASGGDPDRVPPVPQEAKTQRGEVCGNHWEVSNTHAQADVHKACFPVALPQKAILMLGERVLTVFELFAGSGSTLIACEATRRQCRAIELDPLYCDVIVQRWEDFTGKKAVLHRAGPITPQPLGSQDGHP